MMPQEVDILSDQPLKEVDIGWNCSKNYVAMRTRKDKACHAKS